MLASAVQKMCQPHIYIYVTTVHQAQFPVPYSMFSLVIYLKKIYKTINAWEGAEKGNPHALLMGMYIDIATMQNNMDVH